MISTIMNVKVFLQQADGTQMCLGRVQVASLPAVGDFIPETFNRDRHWDPDNSDSRYFADRTLYKVEARYLLPDEIVLKVKAFPCLAQEVDLIDWGGM